MAKAQFHRNQKVWVTTVGTWSVIERIVPMWAPGVSEPVRIMYDVGLGRDFPAAELRAAEQSDDPSADGEAPWRLLRARNKWQQPEDCSHHPVPGTYPVVITDAEDWGGWRVPGAEYDRDPKKIESQARLIACAPRLMALARELLALADESGEDAPPEVEALARRAAELIREVLETPAAPTADAKAKETSAA